MVRKVGRIDPIPRPDDLAWLPLWSIRCRLLGLGLLLKAGGCSEVGGDCEDAFYGLGTIVCDIAAEVGEVFDALESGGHSQVGRGSSTGPGRGRA